MLIGFGFLCDCDTSNAYWFLRFFLRVSILVDSCFLLPMYGSFVVFKFLGWINITGKLSMMSLSDCASYINHANSKMGIEQFSLQNPKFN